MRHAVRNAIPLFILLGGLTLVAVAASAEESDRERIEALEKRIRDLEGSMRRSQPPPTPAPRPETPASPDVEKRLSTLEEKLEKREGHALDSDKIHFHGYGEVHYNNPKTQSLVPSHRVLNPETDVHRIVLGAGYEFTDTIRIDGEWEFEHAGGTLEQEYAFLEVDINSALSWRAGSLLMPMGPLNEFHEPTNFYSVERPYVETYLVPSTWMEVGTGLVGRSGDGKHAFRGYLVTGLTGASFTDDQGIRGGRTKGNQGAADDLGIIARYETSALPIQGLRLGFSGYRGEADQNNATIDNNVNVTMSQADFRYRRKGFEWMGSGVTTRVGNAGRLSDAKKETIGDKQEGWYSEVAYHITAFEDKAKETDKEFVPFLRHERFDTHASVPGGFMQGRENDRQVWTTGLAFFPTKARNVVIKGDVENWRDAANATGTRFNLGMGYSF